MKLICRELSAENDGIPGYIAHPDRKEPGPGILIVRHHYGVNRHLKSVLCNFAKLGYATVVPDLYKILGYSRGNGDCYGPDWLNQLGASWRIFWRGNWKTSSV